jgi:hypothetical protein
MNCLLYFSHLKFWTLFLSPTYDNQHSVIKFRSSKPQQQAFSHQVTKFQSRKEKRKKSLTQFLEFCFVNNQYLMLFILLGNTIGFVLTIDLQTLLQNRESWVALAFAKETIVMRTRTEDPLCKALLLVSLFSFLSISSSRFHLIVVFHTCHCHDVSRFMVCFCNLSKFFYCNSLNLLSFDILRVSYTFMHHSQVTSFWTEILQNLMLHSVLYFKWLY